jgi:hypothetical protein
LDVVAPFASVAPDEPDEIELGGAAREAWAKPGSGDMSGAFEGSTSGWLPGSPEMGSPRVVAVDLPDAGSTS